MSISLHFLQIIILNSKVVKFMLDIQRVNCYLQSNIERLKSPYPSNCTNSWTETPFSDVFRDVYRLEEAENDSRLQIDYKIAVRHS